MLLKYFYDELLAQASYMVGCQSEGIAIVIDPMRDITPYLAFAIQKGLTITHIAETHIHADFVSGSRQLAAATGAKIILSAAGGDDWQYQFPTEDDVMLVEHGDKFNLGNVKFEVLHTPGHTPEHISYMVTDTANADLPLGIFTGDCLFVGDMGRPDLLDKVTSASNTSEAGARQQYANIRHFRTLPDYLQIFPAHGAGSACGKALGALPTSTLGYEKLFNPGFQHRTEDAFVAWLLEEQPEPPTYFAHLKVINRNGATLLHELPQAQHVRETPGTDIVPPDALFIDTRPISEFQHKHINGSINIPISSSAFNTYVGWYVNYAKPTFFIAYQIDVQDVLQALFAIGVDNVPAYFTPDVVESSADTSAITPVQPQATYDSQAYIVDVRGITEYNHEHIADAHHIPMGKILEHLETLPHQQKVVVYCETGIRSQVVMSLLHSMGYPNVYNLDGGIQAWKKAGLPVEVSD